MQFIKTLLYRPYWFLRRNALRTLVVLRLLARRLRSDVSCQPIVWFIAAPRHGNLGDHAIVEAQYAFFADMGLASRIAELGKQEYLLVKEMLPRLIRPRDCIVIDGGGNIGTLWMEEETAMRDIMLRFPQNPIFIFPQTAFFEDSAWGEEQLRESVRVYSSHADLTVFCRDTATYDLFCREFPKVCALYVPDMVLYRSHEMHLQRGRDVLLCMRADKEKTAESQAMQDAVRACLEDAGVAFDVCSTVTDYDISKSRRASEIRAFLEKLSGARFVVTDRLHGMLFCAVTATPCIALDNISCKVSGGYAWLEHLPYIRLCTDLPSAVQAAQDFIRETPTACAFDNAPLQPYYAVMRERVEKKSR